MIFAALASWLIARAKRTPYFHLHHADGTLYMERYWLLQTRWANARVHCIHTADLDRHMHDHPWSFISVVLRGFYLEHRPREIEPIFFKDGAEWRTGLFRRVGSFAFRRATDRHRITTVSCGGVWTLFITFPKRQWWGFYTPSGKIHWKNYESVHNTQPITEEPK